MLLDRLRAVMRSMDPEAVIVELHPRFQVFTEHLDEAGEKLARVFGVHRVTKVSPNTFTTLEDLAEQVEQICQGDVEGRTFAVRVRRKGRHDWNSEQGMRTIGGRLWKYARKVDLSNPGQLDGQKQKRQY